MKIYLTFFFLILLSACSKKDSNEYEHELDPNMPYSNLSQIISKLDGRIIIYKGLPHQMWEQEKLQEELKKGNHHKRKDFHFYNTPIILSADKTKQLVKLLSNPSSFSKGVGIKACGGFHPDFSVVWERGKQTVEIHVCLGCHEIKAYKGNISSYCDIEDAIYTELKQILQPNKG